MAGAAHTEGVEGVNIDLGQDDGESFYSDCNRPPLAPLVDGIRVFGAAHGLDVAEVDRFSDRRVFLRRPTGRHCSVAAPDKTTERAAAVMRALLVHWAARQDLPAVHRAAARTQAVGSHRETAREAARLDEQVRELTARREAAQAAAARLADLAADADQLDLFAS